MPSLTDAEKVVLQRAVSEHGRDWGAIVATGALGTRTGTADCLTPAVRRRPLLGCLALGYLDG